MIHFYQHFLEHATLEFHCDICQSRFFLKSSDLTDDLYQQLQDKHPAEPHPQPEVLDQ